MTNKQIIIDYMELNLSYYHNENDGEGEYSIKEKDLEQFATTLLSKLQTLDRGNMRKIWNGIFGKMTGLQMQEIFFDQICQLIPEEKDIMRIYKNGKLIKEKKFKGIETPIEDKEK